MILQIENGFACCGIFLYVGMTEFFLLAGFLYFLTLGHLFYFCQIYTELCYVIFFLGCLCFAVFLFDRAILFAWRFFLLGPCLFALFEVC